jgi:co-chaperonin GroES (HSP10)
MKLIPLRNDVVIQAASQREQTSRGVFILSDTKNIIEGRVLAVSKDATYDFEVKVGDIVWITKDHDPIVSEFTEYYIVDEGDILGIVED